MDIFIGGGGDDLWWMGLGVVRHYVAQFSSSSGRPAVYLPNARTGRASREIKAASERGEVINVVGHSWGAVDAYVVTVAALRRGVSIANLITLDPVSGPLRRPPAWRGGAFWLNIELQPTAPDASDRLTSRRPFAVKPSRLPIRDADEHFVVDLNHWDVARMMRVSGAESRLLQALSGPPHQATAPLRLNSWPWAPREPS